MLKSPRKLILSSVLLLVAACGAAFAMVLGVFPPSFWLSGTVFLSSVGGVFIGVLGAALYVGERRHRDY
jgi:hypothetical protein